LGADGGLASVAGGFGLVMEIKVSLESEVQES